MLALKLIVQKLKLLPDILKHVPIYFHQRQIIKNIFYKEHL